MVWKEVLEKCAIFIDLLVLSLRVQLSASHVLPGTTLKINPSPAVINQTITIECMSKHGDQDSEVVYNIKQDDRQIAFARLRCRDNRVLENKTCPGCNNAVLSCGSFAANNLVAQRKSAGNYKCEVTHITKGYEPFYGHSNNVLLSVGEKTPPVKRLEVRDLADGRLFVDGATVEAGTNTSVTCETNSVIPEPVFVVRISGRKDRTNLTIQNLQTIGYRVAFHESVPRLPNVDYLCEVFNGFGTKQFKRISINATYSPQTIEIFPQSSTSCGDLDKSDNVKFEVISDDGNPMPNHSCTAWSSSGVQLNMLMNSSVNKSADRKLKSTWFCSNCSSVANLTVKCITMQSKGMNRTDEWNCVSLENVAMSLTNPVNCSCQDESPDMEFQLIYKYVGPVPNHICSAWDIFGTQLTMKQTSQTKTANNTMNSTWLCSNCNNVAHLTVKCRVTQSNRSNRSVEWKSECSDCGTSLSSVIGAFLQRNMAILMSSLCSIAVLAAICLVIMCKRVNQKAVTPPASNHRLVQFKSRATDISKPAAAADLMASTELQEQPFTFDFPMMGMMMGATKAP